MSDHEDGGRKKTRRNIGCVSHDLRNQTAERKQNMRIRQRDSLDKGTMATGKTSMAITNSQKLPFMA